MAARGFFVCRAAGGLSPSRWRPKARGAAAGHRPGPGSAARAACEAGRLDLVQKFLTGDETTTVEAGLDEHPKGPEKGSDSVGRNLATRQQGTPKQRRRVVADGDDGVSNLIHQIAGLAGRLEPAESWSDVQGQAPGIISHHVDAMVNLFRGQDAFDLLELTRQHEIPPVLDGYRASQSEGLAAVIDVVALVALGIGSRQVAAEPHADVPHPNTVIEEMCAHARALVDLAAVLSFTVEGSPADRAVAPLAAQLRLAEIMIRNKHYHSVGRRLNEGVLGLPGNEKLLAEKLGFNYNDVRQVSSAILDLYRTAKFADFEKLGQSAEKHATGSEPDVEELAAAQQSLERLFIHPGAASAFTADQIATATGLHLQSVQAVLDTFSVSMPLASPTAVIELFCGGKNLLAGRELVHDGKGNYIMLHSGIGEDQVRRVIELKVKGLGDTKAWDRFSKQRDGFAEKAAAELMSAALGVPSPQHTGLKYLAPPEGDASYDLSRSADNPKRFARIVEGDLLFLVDDVAICVEVKAGSITDKARSGNVQRVATDLRKTIGEATTQAQRLEQLILTNGGLWRENGRWLDLPEVREVRTVVACLDDFGPLAIAADTLVRANLIGGTTLPWIVSLHDLEIVSQLLGSPSSFLLYLRRRTEPQAARMFEAVDELDVLMWFVQGGLYFEPDPDELYRRYPTGAKPTGASRARFSKETFTRVGTLTDALDAWMYHQDGVSTVDAPKPERHEHPLLQSMVDALKAEGSPGWLRIGADLFNLSEESQTAFADKIAKIVEQTHRDKSFHSLAQVLVTPWGYSAVFVGTQPFGNLGASARLDVYATAKKHQLKADRALAVLLDENGRIAWSNYKNDPWTPNEELDRIVLDMGLIPVKEMDRNPPPSARRSTRRLNPNKRRGRKK